MSSKQKQKHLLLLRKKVKEKLSTLQDQKNILLSTITDYVEKCEKSAYKLLEKSDSQGFMDEYLELMQDLERCCNTCMLLTGTAEEMIAPESTDNKDDEDDSSTGEAAAPGKCSQESHSQNATKVLAENDNDNEPGKRGETIQVDSDTSLNLSSFFHTEGGHSETMTTSSRRESSADIGEHMELKASALISERKSLSREDSPESGLLRRGSEASGSGKSEDGIKTDKESLSLEYTKISEAACLQNMPAQTVPQSGEENPNTNSCNQVIANDSEELKSQVCTVSEEVTVVGNEIASGYGLGPSLTNCTLSAGHVVPVMVSEICTPWSFYIQLYGLALDRLQTSINVYISSLRRGESCISEPVAGMVCLGLFVADNQYYRIKVIRVTESENGKECEAIYVDYGNCDVVSASTLLQLPPALAELPSQAIFCSLCGVCANNQLGFWTEDEIHFFRRVVFNQQLNCKATFVSPRGSLSFPHLVELFLNVPMQRPPGEPAGVVLTQVSIADVMVRSCQARSVPVSEQIAKLQNQFGDIPTPPSSKQSSPEKQDRGRAKVCVQKKNPESDDVIVESFQEIVTAPTMSSHPEDANVTEESSPVQVNSFCESQTAVRPLSLETVSEVEGSSDSLSSKKQHNATLRKQYKSGVSNAKAQNSCDAQQNETNMSQTKGQDSNCDVKELPESKTQSSCGDPKSRPSGQDSCSEGETTSSGITDMSLLPLSQADLPSLQCEDYEVMIAHVNTPCDFYIHKITEDVGQTLDRLMKDLNLHFERQSRKRLQKLYRSFKPELKELCCAQFSEDNNYYRGVILGLKEADKPSPGKDSKIKKSGAKGSTGSASGSENIGKVHVLFMDFGDDEWVPRSKVYPLPEEFSCFPPLTVWCSLSNVRPVGEAWTEENINTFCQLTGAEKRLCLSVDGQMPKFERCMLQTTPLSVYLTDVVNSEEEICVNLELLRLEQATFLAVDQSTDSLEWSDPDDPVDQEWNMSWDPRVEDFMSLRNSYNIDVDDAGVATVGYKAKDERRICKYFNTPSQCWRGDHCPFAHVEHGSGITQDQELVFALEDDQSELLPNAGIMVAVEVTSILSPRHFYLTLPFGKIPIDQLRREGPEEDEQHHEETLEELVKSMNMFYKNSTFYDRDASIFANGQAVAAMFVSEEQIGWYRAKVTDTHPEEEKVEVFFVDFGHTEWVSERNIRSLAPRFLHLIPQAIECFLVDADPAGQDTQWSEESRNFFHRMVDGKTLVAVIKIKSWSGCLHVDLFDTTGKADVNICDELVKAGYAQRPRSESPAPVQRSKSPEIVYVPG